jgi:hypothetical protein
MEKAREPSRAFFVLTNAMTYVQSSALEQVSYDPDAQTLCATFRDSGRTYIYEGVPEEVYDSLIFSDSLGAYFNTHIKGRFAFREVGDASPSFAWKRMRLSTSMALSSRSEATASNLRRK